MRTMITRTFLVDAPAETAWRDLVDAAGWPRWAHHLRRVEVEPPGDVGPHTRVTLRLRNLTTARVAVDAFEPGRRFRWHGSFLWLRLGYDHLVESVDGDRSRITFVVEASGRGLGSIGRVFARAYTRNLDRAIPRLVQRLETAPPPDPRPSAPPLSRISSRPPRIT